MVLGSCCCLAPLVFQLLAAKSRSSCCPRLLPAAESWHGSAMPVQGSGKPFPCLGALLLSVPASLVHSVP